MTAFSVAGGRIVATGGGMYGLSTLLDAPRDGLTANGGDQSYGQNSTSGFVSYTASGPGTAAYTAVQFIGSYNLVMPLGGSFEGFQTATRTKTNLVTAIKGLGTYPNTRNSRQTPYVFLYGIFESSQDLSSGTAYQALCDIIRANGWWVYTTPGGSTQLAAQTTGFFVVNYAYAWNTSAGSAGLDQPIVGNVYGTSWNGFSVAETGTLYFCDALLTNNPQWFTSQTNGAAPNADGLFLDNCFTFPGANLGATTASWDGIGTQTNNLQAAYPTGASSLIARGQFHVFDTMHKYLAARNPGSSYITIGNFGNYFNVVGYGAPNTYTANAMANQFQGGLVETVFGTGGSSYENFQTFAQVLQGYNATMDFCLEPKLVGIGMRLPATDGSQTATWRISGSSTTVTTGTSQEYQCMRAGLCFTLLDDGYAVFIVSGNRWQLLRYYDEQGDDTLTQVNVRKQYLGARVGARPTSAAFANGMWAARFQYGLALFNPWLNGSQTLSLADIQAVFPGNWQCLAGTQQPTINTGTTFTSRTFGDPDGQILILS